MRFKVIYERFLKNLSKTLQNIAETFSAYQLRVNQQVAKHSV